MKTPGRLSEKRSQAVKISLTLRRWTNWSLSQRPLALHLHKSQPLLSVNTLLQSNSVWRC